MAKKKYISPTNCTNTKEVIRDNERYCKISNDSCEVIVSSPYYDDKIENITKLANELMKEHSKKSKFNYLG